jgi:hypothetical protein
VVSRRQADSSRWLGERPSLEYQHAFDLCAVEAHRTGGPVAIFTSSPFYARELLKRLDGCEVWLVPTGNWSSSGEDIGKLLSPEVEHPNIETLNRLSIEAEAAVWAEPERESGEQILTHIHRMLLPGRHLYVIASGWLARFLPEWQRNEDRPGERLVGLRQTTKWLRQSGFTIEARYGFHGPVSILWGYAFRMMERLGRGDLADRCLFKMRAEYVVSGWQAFWVPVGLAVARTK